MHNKTEQKESLDTVSETSDENIDEEPAVKINLKASIAGVAGNALEWYDFATFGFFSDAISKNFFPPEEDDNAALIKTFAVFGAAFCARPFGGLLIGILGDTHGRKRALVTSIILMVIPTFLLGCLPPFSMIGWGSTCLLVILRLLQGLSVGGQGYSSLTFTLEQTHKSRWCFWGSTLYASSCIGVTVGSAFSAILRETLTEEQLIAWGWRIPFFFAIFGTIPAIYLKYNFKENQVNNTADGMKSSQIMKQKKNPLRETFRGSNLRALLAAIILPSAGSSTYYLTYIWIATYMETIMDPPVPHAMTINAVTGIVGGVFITVWGGWIGDKVGDYPKQLFLSFLSLAIISPFLFFLIGKSWGSDASIPYVCFILQMMLAVLLALLSGPSSPWLLLKFPPEVRLTSVALGSGIATLFWGGFSPAIATALYDNFGRSAPGFFISISAIVSMQALWIAPKVTYGVKSSVHQLNEMNMESKEPSHLRDDDDKLTNNIEII